MEESISVLKSLQDNWAYMNPMSRRVGYIGWIGYENLGDEALLAAFQKLFSPFVTVPYKESPKIKLFERLTRRPVYDAVSLGGGTLINNGGYHEVLQTAQQNGRLTFVFGAGVRNPSYWAQTEGWRDSLKIWAECLGACSFVGVRGPLSKQLLNAHNFYKVDVIGDIALSLGRDQVRPKMKQKKLGINVGISNGKVWGSEGEILQKIVEFSKVMIGQGWQLTFVPVWYKDLDYIAEAIKRIGQPIPVFPDYRSVEKTMNFLEGCDVFVGEKLHSVILAMAVHTPAVMLEYRPKCLDFMESMELAGFNVRTDQISVPRLVESVGTLYDNLPDYQRKIDAKLQYYKSIQVEKSQLIIQTITKRLNSR